MSALWFDIVFVAASATLLLAPPLHFLLISYKSRETEILKSFSVEAREAYLMKFFKERLKGEKAGERFEKIYHERFGRARFVPPGILLAAIVLVVGWLVAAAIFAGFVPSPDRFSLTSLAVLAFAGSYMWCGIDVILRLRRQDFAPADIYWLSLRLLIAPALGYAFSSILADPIKPFMAFALGAFPLEAILTMLRRLAATRLNLDMPGESGGPLGRLDGVDRDIADRLSQQGITTVAKLAYCDPLQLAMRSNLEFNFVLDIVNQALAALYLDGHLDKLRLRGLRGAYEVKYLVDELREPADPDEPQKPLANYSEVLKSAAAAIGITENELKHCFEQIADDPFTVFIYSVFE